MTKKLIVANWKSLPASLAEAESILEFTDDYLGSLGDSVNDKLDLVFCPPFIFIEEIARILKTSNLSAFSSLGAQNISIDGKGVITGEISGAMLGKIGTGYVIIGHSERRWKLGESDELTNKKLKAALGAGLVPIVCIGEKNIDGERQKFLEDQIVGTFAGLPENDIKKCIIAYEPVWAISTNPDARPDTPESALNSIKIIDEILNSKFRIQNSSYLYGGSVNSKNVGDFLKEKEINGVLVGGASVNKEEFIKILEIAIKI